MSLVINVNLTICHVQRHLQTSSYTLFAQPDAD